MAIANLFDFVLVATHGGFGRASRATGVSKATLSRHVADLETRLGVRLIERGSGAIRLTEEGMALHLQAEGPVGEITDALEGVSSGKGDVRGRLRISAAVVFAHSHLGKIAAAYSIAYPDVTLELSADDRMVDPVQDGFDIVIRANPMPTDQLVGRCFLRTQRLAVAAPSFPQPKHGGTVRAVSRTFDEMNTSWRLRTRRGVKTLHVHSTLCYSSLLMVRDAVLAGAGAAILPRTLVAEDLASKRLVCWGEQDGVKTELWALHASRKLVSKKVRTFLHFLEQAFPDQL